MEGLLIAIIIMLSIWIYHLNSLYNDTREMLERKGNDYQILLDISLKQDDKVIELVNRLSRYEYIDFK